MDRRFFALGSVFAFVGVAAGAFGAHALREHFDAYRLGVWETAVRYQMYQSLALLAVAWAAARWPGKAVTVAGWAFVVGIVVFSGSLYALAATGVKALGAVTPLGGLAFLVGWGSLAAAAWRKAP